MCGIAGTIGPKSSLAEQTGHDLIKQMCDVIAHRGPNDWGFRMESFADSEMVIGMRRLSIIDISSGHQPICNEDKTIWIVFNGEIYNYRELRKDLIARGHWFKTQTDTETIVHLYEELGEAVFAELRGMFALALWDERERKLLLARDRIGKKPLFYCWDGRRMLFG